MKKILLTITMVLAIAVLATTPVLAATSVTLSTTNTSIQAGQTFTVSIAVDPQGINNYVEMVELNYPADLVEVNSFALAGTWMELIQPGYDRVDNTNGVLIKSAGYPGGFSSATTFGTVSFTAKKAGSGTITVGSNSVAFEANGQGAMSGSPIAFIVTPTEVAATATPTTNTATTMTAPVSGTKTEASVAEKATDTTTTTTEEQKESEQAQASLFGILDTKSGQFWMVLIIAILFAGFGGYKATQVKKNGLPMKK